MTDNSNSAARPIDYEELRRVADLAQIVDVATVRFAASSQGPMMALDASSLGQRISFRAGRLPTPAELVVAMIDFEFVVLTPDQQKLAEIEGTVSVVYGMPPERPDFSDEQLDLFAEVNGIYTAWPYVRELVSTCGARLRMGGLALPVWRPPASLPPEGEAHVMERTPSPMNAIEE